MIYPLILEKIIIHEIAGIAIYIAYKLATNKFQGRQSQRRRQERKSIIMMVVVLVVFLLSAIQNRLLYFLFLLQVRHLIFKFAFKSKYYSWQHRYIRSLGNNTCNEIWNWDVKYFERLHRHCEWKFFIKEKWYIYAEHWKYESAHFDWLYFQSKHIYHIE